MLPWQPTSYHVNRDTLFCYHRSSEEFLQRLMSLYVASHYKNSPNDLQLLSDAPAHHIFVLLGPLSPSSSSLPEILCVLQVKSFPSVSDQLFFVVSCRVNTFLSTWLFVGHLACQASNFLAESILLFFSYLTVCPLFCKFYLAIRLCINCPFTAFCQTLVFYTVRKLNVCQWWRLRFSTTTSGCKGMCLNTHRYISKKRVFKELPYNIRQLTHLRTCMSKFMTKNGGQAKLMLKYVVQL